MNNVKGSTAIMQAANKLVAFAVIGLLLAMAMAAPVSAVATTADCGAVQRLANVESRDEQPQLASPKFGSSCLEPCDDGETGYVVAGVSVCKSGKRYDPDDLINKSEICSLLELKSGRAYAAARLCQPDAQLCDQPASEADVSCLANYELISKVKQTVTDQVNGLGGGNASAAGAFSLGCYTSLLMGTVPGYLGIGCAGAAAFAADANFEKKFLWKTWDFHIAAGGAGCGGGAGGTLGVTPAVECHGVATTGGSAEFGCKDTAGALLDAYAIGCTGASVTVSDDYCAESSAQAHASNMPQVKETTDATAQAASAGCGSLLSGLASGNAQIFDANELPADVIPTLKSALVEAVYAAYEPALATTPPLVQAIGLLTLGDLEQGIMNMDVDHVFATPLE